MKSLLHSLLFSIVWFGTIFIWASTSEAAPMTPKVSDAIFNLSIEELMDLKIVTARVGAGKRSKVNTSYSITNINNNQIRMNGASSVVGAVKTVPGFWVEESGGVASENIRARGIPRSGFQSVNLLEDGIPTQFDPYPNGQTTDQSFRLDETIERIEVVRGGPSSTFHSFAPAGVINFIPRRVGDEASGLFTISIGDDDISRADFWFGKPMDNGWKAYTGGFYREGNGVRDPGYKAYSGGQIRFGLEKKWQDSQLSFDFKSLDDIVPFYIDGPFTKNADGSISGVPGFSATHGNYAGPELNNILLKRADGREYLFHADDGTHIERQQFTIKYQRTFLQDWQLLNSLNWAQSDSNRNDVSPLTISSTPAFLADQVDTASEYGFSNLRVRRQNATEITNPENDLLMTAKVGNNYSRYTQLHNDLRLLHTFDIFGQQHDISLGYSYAYYRQTIESISAIVLIGAEDQAPIYELQGLNSNNQLATLSDPDGVIRQGSGYGDDDAQIINHALYFSDEWILNDNWRIDFGLRWEQATTRGKSPIRQNYDFGTYATRSLEGSSGEIDYFKHRFQKSGWTLGANYQINDHSGIFARVTPTYRLPGLNQYIPNESTRVQNTETMTLGEMGYKYSSSWLQIYPTLFYTTYDSVSNNSRVYDNRGNAVLQRGFAETKALGFELEGTLSAGNIFDLNFSVTWQDAQYKNYSFSSISDSLVGNLTLTDYSGNQLVRVPKLNAHISPAVTLMEGALRLQLTYEYVGDRFVDTANTVVLPAYDKIDAAAFYRWSQNTSVYFHINNLTNSIGLTEGNPRAGEIASQDAGENVFLARSIMGRTYRIGIKYRF